MAVAIGSDIERIRRESLSPLAIKPRIGFPSWLQRYGWQVRNLGAIVGIVLLLLASLVAVGVHSLYVGGFRIGGFRRSRRSRSLISSANASANAQETSPTSSVHD